MCPFYMLLGFILSIQFYSYFGLMHLKLHVWTTLTQIRNKNDFQQEESMEKTARTLPSSVDETIDSNPNLK